jgi:hypothetical protein
LAFGVIGASTGTYTTVELPNDTPTYQDTADCGILETTTGTTEDGSTTGHHHDHDHDHESAGAMLMISPLLLAILFALIL